MTDSKGQKPVRSDLPKRTPLPKKKKKKKKKKKTVRSDLPKRTPLPKKKKKKKKKPVRSDLPKRTPLPKKSPREEIQDESVDSPPQIRGVAAIRTQVALLCDSCDLFPGILDILSADPVEPPEPWPQETDEDSTK